MPILPSPKLTPPARLLGFGIVLVTLIAGGTLGYRLIERWPWFDAFYKSVAVLTSIGADMPLSTAGRAFTVMLALLGISTVALAVTEVLRTLVTGELRTYLEGRRMEKRLKSLEHHVIVCGYGRVGQYACARFQEGEIPFVVIEHSEPRLLAAEAAGVPRLAGDATNDATLRGAGINRARALVAAAGIDADNVLITMTAHLLNPVLRIVARANDEATVPKLVNAGATETVSPCAIGGGRLAEAVLGLTAVVRLAEQPVRPGSAFDGATVRASGLRSPRGPLLVAVRRRSGEVVFNPTDDVVLAVGDHLIVAEPRGRSPVS